MFEDCEGKITLIIKRNWQHRIHEAKKNKKICGHHNTKLRT